MINENNLMENNELVKDAVETGTEIVTKVAANNGLMKKVGIGALVAVAGAMAWEGAKMGIGFIKSKAKKKREAEQSEGSDEKTEKTESNEN